MRFVKRSRMRDPDTGWRVHTRRARAERDRGPARYRPRRRGWRRHAGRSARLTAGLSAGGQQAVSRRSARLASAARAGRAHAARRRLAVRAGWPPRRRSAPGPDGSAARLAPSGLPPLYHARPAPRCALRLRADRRPTRRRLRAGRRSARFRRSGPDPAVGTRCDGLGLGGGRGAPDRQDLSQVLHGCRVELGADPREQRFALAPVVVEHADLDQLVGDQADVDFVQHGRREAVLADADERMERVRFRAQGAPRRG